MLIPWIAVRLAQPFALTLIALSVGVLHIGRHAVDPDLSGWRAMLAYGGAISRLRAAAMVWGVAYVALARLDAWPALLAGVSAFLAFTLVVHQPFGDARAFAMFGAAGALLLAVAPVWNDLTALASAWAGAGAAGGVLLVRGEHMSRRWTFVAVRRPLLIMALALWVWRPLIVVAAVVLVVELARPAIPPVRPRPVTLSLPRASWIALGLSATWAVVASVATPGLWWWPVLVLGGFLAILLLLRRWDGAPAALAIALAAVFMIWATLAVAACPTGLPTCIAGVLSTGAVQLAAALRLGFAALLVVTFTRRA